MKKNLKTLILKFLICAMMNSTIAQGAALFSHQEAATFENYHVLPVHMIDLTQLDAQDNTSTEETDLDSHHDEVLSDIFNLFMKIYFKLPDKSPEALHSKTTTASEIFEKKQSLAEESYGRIFGEYAYESLMGETPTEDSPFKQRNATLFALADSGDAKAAELISLCTLFDLCMVGNVAAQDHTYQSFHYAQIANSNGLDFSLNLLNGYLSLSKAKKCTAQPIQKETIANYKHYLLNNPFSPLREKTEILEVIYKEDPEEAINIAQSLTEHFLSTFEDQSNLAWFYFKSQKWEEAIAVYEKITDDASLEDQRNLAYAYQSTHKYKEALALYKNIATVSNGATLKDKRNAAQAAKLSNNAKDASFWLEAIALDTTTERSPEVRSQDNSNAAHAFYAVGNSAKFAYYLFK